MKSRWTHPGLAGIEIGSTQWFEAQLRLIEGKPLVRRCYDLWYRRLLEDADTVPAEYRQQPVLELGSGCGYVKHLRPDVVTSDVVRGVADMVIDARSLPFRDRSLRAILLVHAFHHVPQLTLFLSEALRVLVPGGVIAMIEVAHTPFARFFFSTFHPEPYDDRADHWDFDQEHSMLDSNQALSWIVFFRDREKFRRALPGLRLEAWDHLPWLSYLLSGGVNLRSFAPPWLNPAIRGLDWLVQPLDGLFAIHWHLRIRKAVDG